MTGDQETMAAAQREEPIDASVKSLFLSFLRLGLTAFGGPAMVAYIGELAVQRKKWLDQPTFKSGVALAQSIPGATAMQTAAYVGLRVRGIPVLLRLMWGSACLPFSLWLSYPHSMSPPVTFPGSPRSSMAFR